MQNQSGQPRPHLFKNVSWLLSVEGAAKLSRFATILAMAAFLTAPEYGLVALCLAIHDIFRLLLRAGSGTQVIQCEEHKLRRFSQNAAAIQWLLCLLLALLQFGLAPLFAAFSNMPEASQLLQLMALSYLFYPSVSIKVFMLHRTHRFKEFSLLSGVCFIAENLLIPLLLWLDVGIMSVAYAKVFSAALWFILFSRVNIATFGVDFHLSTMKLLIKTSSFLLLTELSRSVKQHSDVFIAVKLMTPEIFGLYTFAKTASLGISQSFITAFHGAVLPYMSQKNRVGGEPFSKQVIWASVLLSLIFTVQALSAPIYVPLLFGDNWHNAILSCSILCLSAIPSLWMDTYCCSLRAKAEYNIELIIRIIALVTFVLAMLMFSLESPVDFAIFVTTATALTTLLMPSLYRLINSQIFSKNVYPNRSKL